MMYNNEYCRVTERLAYQENIDYINYYDSFLEAVKRKDDLVVFSNGTLKVNLMTSL